MNILKSLLSFVLLSLCARIQMFLINPELIVPLRMHQPRKKKGSHKILKI